jgi:lipopolysaccharide biosynthesis protein
LKVICFYLPQFHPIPENDAWWGKGFTEWTNVAEARPFFAGHYQPHIPADLGFYDLRLEETRIAQAELACEHGIGGFCYYHFWFNGKLLLERPLNEVLKSGKPDFPFCLCWANENWTRRWDGMDREILIAQDYDRYDAEQHMDWLSVAFADRRYIMVGGKPLFLVYYADHIPAIREKIARWRRRASEKGFAGIYLCAVKSHRFALSDDEARALGFDAMVDFRPNARSFPVSANYLSRRANKWLNRLISLISLYKIVPRRPIYLRYRYEDFVKGAMTEPSPSVRTFPCVFPGWDNSPRRKEGAIVIQNDDAGLYGRWLDHACRSVSENPGDERVVFVNAWNEWAEGCYLEPDTRNGRRFLDVTREVLERHGGKR